MTAGTGPGRGVLDGAFALLDVLSEAHEAGLTRLAALSGLPKATVYRLLQQMVELGAVVKHGDRYQIGPRVFSLGGPLWRPDPELEAAANDPVRRLARATGASLHLAVDRHGHAVAAATFHVDRTMPVNMTPGTVAPRLSAASQLLLAWADPVSTRSPLPAALAEEIRHSEIVVERGRILPGIFCIAVPVFGADQARPAAVLVAMVRNPQQLTMLPHALKRTGDTIARALR
jgi:DNA-binding IclR family transcriptional regulator